MGASRQHAAVHPLTAPWSSAVDDLALENHEDDEGRHQDQDGAGAQQGHVGGVVALERPERTGHRPCVGSSTSTSARRNWFHVQTDMRIPRDEIGARASGTWMSLKSSQVVAPSEPGGLRDLGRHVHEVRAHPEHGERHVQADERQHDGEPGVVDPQGALEVVERDDDPPEGKRQPEDEQEKKPARAGDPQQTDGERRHRRDERAKPAPRGSG